METCRTCAKCDFVEENHWFDIFHPEEVNRKEIEHILLLVNAWKLKVSQSDGLPHKICSDCYLKFSTVYELRLQTERAQLKLSNIFLDKIEISTDNNDEEIEGTRDFCKIDANFSSHTNEERKLFEILNDYDDDNDDNDDNIKLNTANTTNLALFKHVENDDFELIGNEKINETTAANIKLNENKQYKVSSILLPLERTKESIETTALPSTILSKAQQHLSSKIIVCTETIATQKHKNDFFNQTFDNNNDDAIDFDELIENNFEEFDDDDGDDDDDSGGGGDDNNVSAYNVGLLKDARNVQCEDEDDNDDMTLGFKAQTIDDISYDSNNNDDSNDNETFDDEFYLTFECKYCYEPKDKFKTQKLLLDHITRHHDSKLPFNCPKCEKCFSDAAKRSFHIKSDHAKSEKNFSCEVCGKRYTDLCNLRHHIEKYHADIDFECDLCEKRFYSRKSLNYHKKWHDPSLQQKCAYCERLFINKNHLKSHEETHTGLRNSEYCSFCGKSFIHLKTLRWHIYRHHGGEKPYKCGCGSCDEVFSSYREKRIHMLDKHAENLTGVERSECMLCHVHFSDEKELKHHMAEDHKPRKETIVIANNKRMLQNKCKKSFSGIFECGVCSQRFNMKLALDRHSAVHSIEGRPYACPQCPKRFKRSQDMNWHLKTHSGKSNICDVCGKGFALKYVLTQHKRSHEVLEKNFKCSTCGRAYLFEKTLRVHERVHSDKTYYKCDLCDESFVTHIKFKYHMNKKHSPDENGEIPLDDFINIVIP